jgi:hypothetical protein
VGILFRRKVEVGVEFIIAEYSEILCSSFLICLLSWIGLNTFCNERVVVVVVSNLSYRWSIKLKR